MGDNTTRPRKEVRRRRTAAGGHRNAATSLRRGTSAVEFVFVLPVLFVIVIGATDLGRVIHVENVISNAARVGAAYGATHQFTEYTFESWQSEAEDCARQEAAHLPGYDPNLLSVNVDAEDDADGSRRVRVDVSYPFELIFDWPGWPGQLMISRYVTMRAHR